MSGTKFGLSAESGSFKPDQFNTSDKNINLQITLVKNASKYESSRKLHRIKGNGEKYWQYRVKRRESTGWY